MACLVLPYFSTLAHKHTIFERKKITEHKICFWSLQLRKYFSFDEELIQISYMYIGFHVKYSIFLSDFLMTREYSKTDFRKILKYKISWNKRPVGAEIFQTGRRTGMTKRVVAFRNFANEPNKTDPRIAHSVQELGYGLDNRGTLVRFPTGVRDFLI